MMHRFRPGLVTAALLIAVQTLSSCTTLDPYTREEKTSKATKGAAIGAVSGAVVGLATGKDAVDRRQKALIGAGLGGITGGAIGYYMDRQEMMLRQKLEGTGVSVTRAGDNVILNMPGHITFQTNSADLNAGFFGVLDSVGLVLEEYNQTVIEAVGHTDSTGTEEYNQGLSERRARTVGDYLIQRGVMSLRVITLGLGETRPVAGNATPEGRQRNRRVELTLYPVRES